MKLVPLLALLLMLPSFVFAQDVEPAEDVKARYQHVVELAVTEHAAGNWAEARALFLQAHALWPSARTFRTLGMTSYELKHYARAISELQASLDDLRRPLDETKRAEVQALLIRARGFVGRYVVQLSSTDATLDVDGQRVVLPADHVLLLAIGTHTLVAKAPGCRDAVVPVTVQGSEDTEIALLTPPVEAVEPQVSAPVAVTQQSSPPTQLHEDPSHPWKWIAAGTTVVLGAAALGLYLGSNMEFDRLNKECMGTCRPGEVDTTTYDALLLTSQISFGLSLAAAVGTVVLFIVEPSDDPRATGTSVRVGPGNVQFRTTF